MMKCSARGAIRLGRRFAGDRAGASAVEFALISPVFLLLLAGTIDLGGMLNTRFQLNSAVSAGANYAMVNGPTLTATTATNFVTNAAAIVAGSAASGTTVSVKINNVLTRTVTNGSGGTSGATSSADQCFCPTRSGSTVTWGSAVTCGTVCTNGSLAGKFYQLTASRSYTPMFSGYSFVENNTITVSTVTQVQ